MAAKQGLDTIIAGLPLFQGLAPRDLELIAGCASPSAVLAPSGDGAAPSGRVQVWYPQGDCQTGWLELEVWSASAAAWQGAWLPHPEHPRVRANRCYLERSSTLLNELRVRCIDPEGITRPSGWLVGAQLYPERAAGVCESAGSD